MAGLICRVCDAPIVDDPPACPSCGANLLLLGSVPAPAVRDTTATSPLQADPPSPSAPEEVVRCFHCEATQPASGSETSAYCRLPLSGARGAGPTGRLVLVFPFGEVAVREGEAIELGRFVGPYATCLEPYDKVSRRHAILQHRAGQLVITDVDSTNGTMVQGELLTPNVARVLRAGDEVALSRSCTARVEER